MTILVDSDILTDSDSHILFSPVTAAELWAGARPAEFAALEDLLNVLECVPANGTVGRRAGEYLKQYRKSHNVELVDALIAATAALSGAVLWTRNRKHYPMPELRFYD